MEKSFVKPLTEGSGMKRIMKDPIAAFLHHSDQRQEEENCNGRE